jgi:MFS family permease
MLGLGIIGPIIPLYAESLGANFVVIGLLSSAWSISRLAFTFPVGRVSDTRSKKRIIVSGLVVYVVVSILYMLAWDSTSLLAIRLLHGAGSAMTMPIAMAYAAGLAPKGREGRTLGTLTLAMFAGWGLGPLIGGTLVDLFSMSVPFCVMGALNSLSLILTLVFLPEEVRPNGDKTRPSYRRVLSNPALRAVFVYRAVITLGMGSLMGFLAIYISGSADVGGLGLSVSMAGLVMSLGQVASATLQRPFGELADRHDKVLLVLIGGSIASAGFILFLLSHDVWSVLAAQLVYSMGVALATPALSAIAAIHGRDIGLGTTMGVIETAMSTGMTVGPLVSGIIIEAVGLKPIFSFGGAVTVTGTAAFYLLLRYGGRTSSIHQQDDLGMLKT